MSNAEIIASINKILVEEFEIEEDTIVPSASIMEVLKIDSLDLIDLVVLIEKKFGFKVRSEEMAGIKNLQDFYDYIIRRLNEKG
jgi:acyl carrier protein